ncbi:hypothetical protein Dsin_029772 [Dipteronia sinensis]|uniref:PGG domain-containing protein n=1 Tax=Dipteronia sinensis TaxID=43782 RepID=A0AAE0DVT7_9ROSI|nr:hypothetical protein Dsin_029772 [Dipteronia sinensis]
MDSFSIVNEAASSNNVEMITSLGSTPDQSNDNYDQFFKAAADGNIEPFKKIAQQLHLIVTPLKNTVLHINITSEKVSTEFVEEILGMCPSLLLQVNAQGDPPLHVAAKFEHIDVVRYLINKAKDQQEDLEINGIGVTKQMLRMTNNKGNTALHEAIQSKSVFIVRILIKEDPDFSHPTNNCNETPLYIAVETGFFHGVVDMLNICNSVTHEGPNGKTALHAAIRRKSADLTRQILEKKKSLTKEIDDYGWTPLHYAAYYGYLQVSRILLEFDKSAAYVTDTSRRMTPLHLAASQGHKDVMREIILHCPECYEPIDDRGWNVLHFAMASLNKKELFSLLENPSIKKLVREKDVHGNTPLHVFATCTRTTGSINLLVDIIDQVRGDGSRAINRQNISQEIVALSEDTGNGLYSRGVIHKRDKHYDGYLSLMKGAKESHLVAAALIATVTFAAAFTLPGGYKNEDGKNQGTAILSRNSAFQTFVITDAIAMVFSISAVFIYFIMSVERFKKYIYLFELGSWFTVVAMGAMVIAFVTGTYAVLATSFWLAIVTCFIGLSFFICVLTVGYRIILHIIKGDRKLMHKIRKLMRKMKRKLKRKIRPIKDYLMRKLAIKISKKLLHEEIGSEEAVSTLKQCLVNQSWPDIAWNYYSSSYILALKIVIPLI